MKPTETQIKEFWEWCGFKETRKVKYYNKDKTPYKAWYYPEGGEDNWKYSLPPIDLNNLFKYAPDYQQVIFQPGYCGITIEGKMYECGGDTEEDTLFWAFDKVRINETILPR